MAPRLIMYHKQSTSARTRFLRLPYGGVCGFAALPEEAAIDERGGGSPKVVTHPARVLRDAEVRLGLPSGSLEMEPGFRCEIAAGEERTEVFLARFTSIDPPFETAQAHGSSFIDLTQARGLPPVELDLLRRSYERILG
ncbi:hypothetical protein [Thiocapsa rosea]|uniref:Uncharacterized protein n=1 Tax=Thiocapsa rosea TaxID=69360 RepID=A0A495VE54_9GAMM|nr:hypothetical protein [Thiocapsa rosea]RKT47544.1 hypothetical protein BDD21_5140 [Thiocapsa rosea]